MNRPNTIAIQSVSSSADAVEQLMTNSRNQMTTRRVGARKTGNLISKNNDSVQSKTISDLTPRPTARNMKIANPIGKNRIRQMTSLQIFPTNKKLNVSTLKENKQYAT